MDPRTGTGSDRKVGCDHVEVSPPCSLITTAVEKKAVDGHFESRPLGAHASTTRIHEGHIDKIQRPAGAWKHLNERIGSRRTGENGRSHLDLTRSMVSESRTRLEETCSSKRDVCFSVAVDENSGPPGAGSRPLEGGGGHVKAPFHIDADTVANAEQDAVTQGQGPVRFHREVCFQMVRAPLRFKDRPAGQHPTVQGGGHEAMLERAARVPCHRIVPAVSVHPDHDHARFRRPGFVHQEGGRAAFHSTVCARGADVARHDDADAGHRLAHVEHFHGHWRLQFKPRGCHGRDRGVHGPVEHHDFASWRQRRCLKQLHTGRGGARRAGPRQGTVHEQSAFSTAEVCRSEGRDLVCNKTAVVPEQGRPCLHLGTEARSELQGGAIKGKACTLPDRQIAVQLVSGTVGFGPEHGIDAVGQHPIAVGKHWNLHPLAVLTADELVADPGTIGQSHDV